MLVPLQLEMRDFSNPWCPPLFQSSQLCSCTRWSGSAATGASWEGRGKRVGFPHFSVDEFFVVSSFSHGEEMLLRSRSDYSNMVPLVCSWLG